MTSRNTWRFLTPYTLPPTMTSISSSGDSNTVQPQKNLESDTPPTPYPVSFASWSDGNLISLGRVLEFKRSDTTARTSLHRSWWFLLHLQGRMDRSNES